MHFLNPKTSSKPEFSFTFWFITEETETSSVSLFKFCSGSHSLAKVVALIKRSTIANYSFHYCYYLTILHKYKNISNHTTKNKREQLKGLPCKFGPLRCQCKEAEIFGFGLWKRFCSLLPYTWDSVVTTSSLYFKALSSV